MHHYITILRSVSTQNRYLEWYCRIVQNGLSRASTRKHAKSILGYTEGHHIVPRSYKLGGESDPDNIVYLSAKEHILIHRLLCKFSQGDYRIHALRAFHCMCVKDNGGQNKRHASSLQLLKAREAIIIANSRPRGIQGPPKWSKCSDLDFFKTEIINHVNSRKSDPEIGKIYGVSSTAVFNWRAKLDIENRRPQLKNQEWLYKQYVENNLSSVEIAKIIGCTGAAVQQYLNRFGISIRDVNNRIKNRKLMITGDTLQLSCDALLVELASAYHSPPQSCAAPES